MGEVVAQRIDQLGLRENTIVVFLTDNGPNSDRFNGNMRGRKGSVHEGGVRVPLFIRWPGQIIPETSVALIAAHIDLQPTLLDMCGITRPDGPPLDGISLWPLIQRQVADADRPDRLIFTSRTSGQETSLSRIKGAVRSQKWRATFENGRWSLFDMQHDPGQRQDVATDNPATLKRLSNACRNWLKDVHPEAPTQPVIPLLEHSALNGRTVELPAHEAFLESATGRGIRYAGSAGYANSWVSDWTDRDASIVWKVDVPATQKWQAVIQHSCRTEDAGCLLRFSSGETFRKFVVEEGHDGNFKRSLERIPPSPHYAVRKWQELSLGQLTLTQGRQEIRISGIRRPGARFIEVKSLRLQPVLDMNP